MFKTHHKMKGWNREFQYLHAKIIGKFVKYQYFPTKTIHFSLSHLTLSSLSHIPPSSLLLALIPLSITLCHSWTALIWIYSHASRQRAELEADYSSVRPCVRASVPLLGESQNLCFCTILSEISENHICILRYLATVAFKTQHKIDTFFGNCPKHTIRWDVEIADFNISQLKWKVKSLNFDTSHLK